MQSSTILRQRPSLRSEPAVTDPSPPRPDTYWTGAGAALLRYRSANSRITTPG